MVPAVHAPPGQVDRGVRSVDLSRPIPNRLSIPPDHPPRSLPRIAAQYHHLMAVRDKSTRQQCADLPASSGDDNLHVSSLRTAFLMEILRLKPRTQMRRNATVQLPQRPVRRGAPNMLYAATLEFSVGFDGAAFRD